MVKRTMAALAAVVVLLSGVFAATPALAWTGQVDGRPEQLRPEAPAGYYIWRGEHGIHLRTTGGGPEHHFTGTVTTDGLFRGVAIVRREQVDSYSDDGGQTLSFDFTTYGGVDGLSFRIAGGTQVTFDLYMDGQPIPVEQIWLGRDGAHPESNPFTVER